MSDRPSTGKVSPSYLRAPSKGPSSIPSLQKANQRTVHSGADEMQLRHATSAEVQQVLDPHPGTVLHYNLCKSLTVNTRSLSHKCVHCAAFRKDA